MNRKTPLFIAMLASAALSAHAQNLVTNPGLESGNFTGWTLFGSTSLSHVNGHSVHSGMFSAELGNGAIFIGGSLEQNITTVAGQLYHVDFWLANSNGQTFHNIFGGSFAGVTILSLHDSGDFGYTHFSGNVTATSTSSVLGFGFFHNALTPPNNLNGYWYLDDVSVTPTSTPYDFNGDGKPDYVLYYATTRQTALWYLNNNVYIGAAYAPTLPAGWTVVDVADFNRDGHNDYTLFNPSTRQTAIWYLNNNVYIGGGYGPTLPSGWQLVAVSDFNGDGKPDYVLFNPSTRQTAIWYLNNRVYVGGGYGPTLPSGWQLVAVGDFNVDGKPDYVLYNPSTRQTAIWYLNNTVYVSGAGGPAIASGYVLSGVADFNGDGKPDYLLYNPSTRVTAIWYMNNNVRIGTAFGPTLTAGWSLAAP
jgi:hypothetical protein